MLNTNLVKKDATVEMSLEFAVAVKVERFKMELQLAYSSIASLDKKIENKSGKYTVTQVEGFKEEKEALESEIEGYKSEIVSAMDTYKKVLSNLTAPKKCDDGNEYSNDLFAVRRTLRAIASTENSKLNKYVLIASYEEDIDSICDKYDEKAMEWDSALYDAFETCHTQFERSNENGQATCGKAEKEAYSQAQELITSTLKSALSMPIESEYTNAFRAKFKGATLRKLHEAYVGGFTNKYELEKDEEGKVTGHSYKSTTAKTLIKKKVDKNGVASYNWDSFNSIVVTLLIEYLA